MSVTSEILRTYRSPRDVARHLFDSAESDDRPEARAFVYLMLGCFIIFCSRVPGMLNADLKAADAPPTEALITITLFLMMTVWPLFFILLAGLAHLVARFAGGRGSFMRSRLALAWTVLAISPLSLLRGMVEAFGGQGAQLRLVDGVIALAFCTIWAISLTEAERPVSS